jgi:hypothetical protein
MFQAKRQRVKDICCSLCAVSVIVNKVMLLHVENFLFLLCHRLKVGFLIYRIEINILFSELWLQTLSYGEKKK